MRSIFSSFTFMAVILCQHAVVRADVLSLGALQAPWLDERSVLEADVQRALLAILRGYDILSLNVPIRLPGSSLAAVLLLFGYQVIHGNQRGYLSPGNMMVYNVSSVRPITCIFVDPGRSRGYDMAATICTFTSVRDPEPRPFAVISTHTSAAPAFLPAGFDFILRLVQTLSLSAVGFPVAVLGDINPGGGADVFQHALLENGRCYLTAETATCRGQTGPSTLTVVFGALKDAVLARTTIVDDTLKRLQLSEFENRVPCFPVKTRIITGYLPAISDLTLVSNTNSRYFVVQSPGVYVYDVYGGEAKEVGRNNRNSATGNTRRRSRKSFDRLHSLQTAAVLKPRRGRRASAISRKMTSLLSSKNWMEVPTVNGPIQVEVMAHLPSGSGEGAGRSSLPVVQRALSDHSTISITGPSPFQSVPSKYLARGRPIGSLQMQKESEPRVPRRWETMSAVVSNEHRVNDSPSPKLGRLVSGAPRPVIPGPSQGNEPSSSSYMTPQFVDSLKVAVPLGVEQHPSSYFPEKRNNPALSLIGESYDGSSGIMESGRGNHHVSRGGFQNRNVEVNNASVRYSFDDFFNPPSRGAPVSDTSRIGSSHQWQRLPGSVARDARDSEALPPRRVADDNPWNPERASQGFPSTLRTISSDPSGSQVDTETDWNPAKFDLTLLGTPSPPSVGSVQSLSTSDQAQSDEWLEVPSPGATPPWPTSNQAQSVDWLPQW